METTSNGSNIGSGGEFEQTETSVPEETTIPADTTEVTPTETTTTEEPTVPGETVVSTEAPTEGSTTANTTGAPQTGVAGPAVPIAFLMTALAAAFAARSKKRDE